MIYVPVEMREGLSGNSDDSVMAQVQRRQRGQREERLIFNHIDLMVTMGAAQWEMYKYILYIRDGYIRTTVCFIWLF